MAIALRLPDPPTPAQIAAQVRTELAVELARIDVPVSSVAASGTAHADIS